MGISSLNAQKEGEEWARGKSKRNCLDFGIEVQSNPDFSRGLQ